MHGQFAALFLHSAHSLLQLIALEQFPNEFVYQAHVLCLLMSNHLPTL